MKKIILLALFIIAGAASCTKYEPDNTLDAKNSKDKPAIIITNGKNMVK